LESHQTGALQIPNTCQESLRDVGKS